MSGSGGTYTFRIENLQEFYTLTDSELEGLTKLGFIAKTTNGVQTQDLFINVEQGRRDAYSGGEGTADSPFILSTPEDILALAATPTDWSNGTFFRMEADIDASALTSPIGSMSRPFGASFDGAGHSIRNISLTGTSFGSPTALFGAIKGGSVCNLGITGAHIAGTTYTGILAGYLESGIIERCYTSGSVEGSSICAGGLVGENAGGEIHDCYSGADVTNAVDYAVGGIAGKNTGIISNTYAAGKVTGYDYAGGVTGANYGQISHSFALNSGIDAVHDFAAPFGGNNNSRNQSASNHSWDMIPNSANEWSGFGDHAEAIPSARLADKNTFSQLSGWDFDNIWEWQIEPGRQYPVLRGIPGQECLISNKYFSLITGVTNPMETVNEIQIGPNPTHGYLHISSTLPIAGYALYTVNGSLLLEATPDAISNEASIDMSGNADGIYILRIYHADGHTHIHKVIKN